MADADNAPPVPPVTRSQLGVLFIHGIGEQKRGDTLLAFGEPLCRWLQASAGSSVQVRRALLDADPRDDIAPAHVHLTLPGRYSSDTPGTCLLAESSWGESFPTPGFSDVARWALLALPWTLAKQFARRFKPVLGDRGAILRYYPQLALDCLFSIATFLAGMVIELLVLALLVLTIVPIQSVREFVLRLHMRIAGIIGDSYALLASSIRSSAILEKCRRDLDWLVGRSERVAIVAHSQGAAIAHRLITLLNDERSESKPQSDPLKAVDLYFSFGSGLGKLHDIEEAFRTGGWTLIGGFVLMLSVLGLPVAIVVALMTPAGPGLLGGLVAMVAGGGFLYIVMFLDSSSDSDRAKLELSCFRPRTPPSDKKPGGPSIRWVDCYATADPVPSGPLLPTPKSVHTRSVVNGHSILFDHTTYWQNKDEFVRLLVDELGAPLTSAALAHADLERASARRRWRLAWLRMVRALGAISAAVFVWVLWEQLHPLGAGVLTVAEAMTSYVERWRSVGLSRGFGGVVVFAIAALWLQLAAVAYRRWELRDFKRAAKGKPLDAGGLPFVTLAAIGLVLPVLTILFTFVEFDLDRAAAVWGRLWEVRHAIAFGSMASPIISAIAATPTFILLLKIEERRGYRGSSFEVDDYVLAYVATALASFGITVLVALWFPNSLHPVGRSTPWREQLVVGTAFLGPYVVGGALVALASWTIGPAIGGWLTKRSTRIPTREDQPKLKPLSVTGIGWVSVLSGGAALLLRLLVDHYQFGPWTIAVLAPFWFTSVVASANAFGRETRSTEFGRSQISAGALGLMLTSFSILWHLMPR